MGTGIVSIGLGLDRYQMPREHAEAFVAELEATERRYRPDLWG
jgi:hypothetical protein